MADKKAIILGLDLSLSCPGFAIVEVSEGTSKILAVSHVKTNAKHDYAVRGRVIESKLRTFLAENKGERVTYVCREKYAGKFGHHSIFTAHAAADRALHDFGLLPDSCKPIAQQSVKKAVCGKGRAEKEEVEEAVRKITGYTGEFATSDESDAVAIALAFAINEGLITKEGEK
ncbi:crossover junction endodeoxyribonuclease RuvC [Oceanobacillus sojae]|uniref:crossover junction endodeoxyribonuclease RuvC n=1 Tax=Oceanobacillus sojae TaxID=582851 RepID=UPI0036317C76